MLVDEHKYLLLLSALLGGHQVDCRSIEYVDEDILREKEDYYIDYYTPCLNILTPSGKQDITHLKIEDVLNSLKYHWDDDYGFIASAGITGQSDCPDKSV
jgi:hypothetical protein